MYATSNKATKSSQLPRGRNVRDSIYGYDPIFSTDNALIRKKTRTEIEMDSYIYPKDVKIKSRKDLDHFAGMLAFFGFTLGIFFIVLANMDKWPEYVDNVEDEQSPGEMEIKTSAAPSFEIEKNKFITKVQVELKIFLDSVLKNFVAKPKK